MAGATISIPGYDLLNRLGGGQVTVVWSARELATDTVCAVKFLRPEWQDQTMAIKLLQREARAALAIKHAHLLPVRHAHVMTPPYFLVMDLLAGESLRRRLRRDYQLPPSEAVWIIRQVTEALTSLHQAGFIHADIKPDNIHLTEEGNAVLLDMGFAHRPGENAALLEQGYVLGTVEYLAPELCLADPIDGYASDMFSLGVTLFEMLSGKLPYPRGSIRQTILAHQNDAPADIRTSVRNLHPALAKLVMKMLSKDPKERPRPFAVVQQMIALEIATLHYQRAA